MRKCAAILCALALTGSLCACKKTPAPTEEKPKTTTTTVTTTVTDDSVKAPLNLTYASPFSDGVAFVRYMDGTVEHTAAINTAGDVLFEVPEDMPIDGEGYKNGIRVVGDVIYDKTGAIIASPELSGYDSLMTGNCGGYVVAKKMVTESLPAPAPETVPAITTTTTAATTGSTTATTAVSNVPVSNVPVLVGVLNNKGEWEQPLSLEHPIAKAMSAAAQPSETLSYLAPNNVLMVYVDLAAAPQYYHFEDNTLTPDYVHYVATTSQEEGDGIYKVAADGTRTLVVADVTADHLFKDVFVGSTVTENDKGEMVTHVKMYDYTGKELADLTDYPLWGNVYYYVHEHLFIPTDDGNGTRSLVVLTKDGKQAYDPVVLAMRDTFRAPDDTGVVVETYTAEGEGSYYHYDWDGVVTEYTNVQIYSGFFDGLAAVTLTDGTMCYINHKAEIVIR